MTALPDPIDVQVGLAIRTRRTALRMSQEKLAEALGVTFQQVQKYERGVNRISASMLVRACRALGVKASAILPNVDGEEVPAKTAALMQVRGAGELVHAYAALPKAQRGAVLTLVRTLAESRSAGDGPPTNEQ